MNDNKRELRFSILIPSWNNLPYLKICVDSIRRNSKIDHQIIIHVNEGSDGTLNWVKEQGLDYTYSPNNIGVCLAMNSMRSKVKTDYILFLNDDMYVLPNWDTELAAEILSIPDNRFFLSSTTIQPYTKSPVVINANFGDSPESFKEKELLEKFASYPMDDWMGATMPPNIVHRDIWDLVGGYSIEYTPGMYSDPDFTAKLWLAGIHYMKGISASRVYHFETKTTTRIKKNPGRWQFLMKWGLTNSTFRRAYTHRGCKFDPMLIDTVDEKMVNKNILRCRLEALWAILRGKFGALTWNRPK